MASCGKKKGCMNEWGINYKQEAIVDCCCEFDLDAILADVVGNYTMIEKCSGNSETYDIIISRTANTDDGISVSNFNNSGFSINATWNEGEFRLENKWQNNECVITTTGSIHKASGKLFFVYAAFPENTCNDTQGITCEARSIN